MTEKLPPLPQHVEEPPYSHLYILGDNSAAIFKLIRYPTFNARFAECLDPDCNEWIEPLSEYWWQDMDEAFEPLRKHADDAHREPEDD